MELVAAGAANVDGRAGQPRGVDPRVHRPGEQGAGKSGDLGGRLAFGAQGAQEGGLPGVGFGGVGQSGDGGLDLRGRESGGVGEGRENAHEAELSAPYADLRRLAEQNRIFLSPNLRKPA